MERYKLAIVGATGLVGKTLLEILKEENLIDQFDITMFVSDENSGKVMVFGGREFPLFSLKTKVVKRKFDFVFFSAGDDVSKMWAETFAKNGAYVIDNSNAFRREKGVPLVVPEINAEKITKNTKIIANPNCSTIELVLVLDKLRKLAKMKKIVVSTYQAVSGAGAKALSDLASRTSFEIKEGINDNAIAYIGEYSNDGFCKEEDKIMFETQKILEENLSICASTVRIPIPFCHLESVYVEFESDVDLNEIKSLFDGKIVKFSSEIVLPTECHGKNTTYVFRLRKLSEKEIAFFVLADNLRRGASFNAIEILKYIMNSLV
jgi:aspartate-semialdehyde dehydrogenase